MKLTEALVVALALVVGVVPQFTHCKTGSMVAAGAGTSHLTTTAATMPPQPMHGIGDRGRRNAPCCDMSKHRALLFVLRGLSLSPPRTPLARCENMESDNGPSKFGGC